MRGGGAHVTLPRTTAGSLLQAIVDALNEGIRQIVRENEMELHHKHALVRSASNASTEELVSLRACTAQPTEDKIEPTPLCHKLHV